MERDWTYFALIGRKVGVLWLLRKPGRGGQRRGIVPSWPPFWPSSAVLYFGFGR